VDREHPSRTLQRKCADLIEALQFVVGEPELFGGEIVIERVDPLDPDNDRCDNRVCQEPFEGDPDRAASMRLGNWPQPTQTDAPTIRGEDRSLSLRYPLYICRLMEAIWNIYLRRVTLPFSDSGSI
jgi:hypothetical protein